MTTEGPAGEALQGFGAEARRALVLAEREARSLSHERVGTEHLLLGLLADEGAAAAALRDAGVALPVARRKVAEAVGSSTSVGDEPLSSSPRCARALGRAARFARDQQSDLVGSSHLLLAVLDVEGTAGQVLRGIGVDIEHLRAALGARRPVATHTEEPAAPGPACPGCHAPITTLTATVVPLQGDAATGGEVTVVSCPTCGTALGNVRGT